MKRLLAIVLGALLLAPIPALIAEGATPNVGHHVHVAVSNVPSDTTIVNGSWTFGLTVLSHDQIGKIVDVRVDSENGVMGKVTIPGGLGPCGMACTWPGSITLNLGSLPTGRHELRFRGEVPTNSEGNEQNSSSGIQVCVRACTPTYRSGDWFEGRGWYDDGHDYSNARLKSDPCSVHAGATIQVDLTSTGSTVKESGVYINPSFHDLDPGIIVLHRNGPYKGPVTLPNIPEPFKLVLVSSDGQNAGVIAIGSGQCGSTYTFEDQAWWRLEGLVIPSTAGPTPTPTPTAVPPTATPTPTLVPTATPTDDAPGFALDATCAPDPTHYGWHVDASGFPSPWVVEYAWNPQMTGAQSVTLPSFNSDFITERGGSRIYVRFNSSPTIEDAPSDPTICDCSP